MENNKKHGTSEVRENWRNVKFLEKHNFPYIYIFCTTLAQLAQKSQNDMPSTPFPPNCPR